MAPYRKGREQERAVRAPEHGAVAEMVRQFADPYAFLRELVQNGLDAGARSLEVRVERTADGLVSTQVSDDGCGMTRAIIEGPLLTLFSSSKEDDTTKIGKYGVGFVSVFALEPHEVTVTTWRSEGALLVRLRPDHSWELETTEPRSGSGTTVSLANQMDRPAFLRHVDRCRDALARWCRHVRVPLHLVAVDLGAPGEEAAPLRERIDAPMDVGALASVLVESGDTVLVVGVDASPVAGGADGLTSLAAFYKRGLLIHQSTTDRFEALAGARFKVDSPALAHTLSRDDVRRDAAFRQVVALVARAARRALPPVVGREIARRAAGVAQGAAPHDWLALVGGALRLPAPLAVADVALPLTDPLGGGRTMTLAEARQRSEKKIVTFAAASNELTVALAARSIPVVRLAAEHVPGWLAPAQPVVERHVLVSPVEPDEPDGLLLDEVARALDATRVRVGRVALGRFSWKSGPIGALVPALSGPTAFTARDLARWADDWSDGRTLVVDVDGLGGVARSRAADARRAAAQLLVRAMLVQTRGALSASLNDALLGACVAAPARGGRGEVP